jgi:predicted RNA-binding Zn ribbon-like protein
MFVLVGAVVERLLGVVALEVVEFLTSGQIDRVRACANPRCGWMFVDTSRNRARRWCEMATCGNRAKARAHYARRAETR